jgi:hypothetical protein
MRQLTPKREDVISPRLQEPCVLVSAGCTIGWTDWIHGELWLCPDGLLRRSLGLMKTVKHGMWPTVNAGTRPARAFSNDDIAEVLAASRRNYWVPWQGIDHAVLRPHRLDLQLAEGGQLTLMWVPVDDISPLKERLPSVLGMRLREL